MAGISPISVQDILEQIIAVVHDAEEELCRVRAERVPPAVSEKVNRTPQREN